MVDRASSTDLMELATDSAAAPQHVAALLVLGTPVPLAEVRAVLAERIVAVPRLRQRLLSTPVGAGRPVWVDDAAFDVERHLTVRRTVARPEQDDLLDVAAEAAVAPLPRDRPLWSATLVAGTGDQVAAVIIVLHHVLADGLGGLAALAQLVDGAPPAHGRRFPAPAPTRREVWLDAWRGRAAAVRRVPAMGSGLREAAAELQLGSVRRPPPRTSLNRPIGPQRRLAVVRVPLAEVVEAARRKDATVNDVVLTAVGGALGAVVRSRGESAATFVVSVPVSGRRADQSADLGNRVGVMPIEVPAVGEADRRLSAVAAATRDARARVGRGRGASAGLLARVFRLLAWTGVFGWFVDRQRLVTTFVTNVRGPGSALSFAGAPVVQIVPLSPIAGNVTVAFAALSYDGTLTLTAIADRAAWPDLAVLTQALREELRLLTVIG